MESTKVGIDVLAIYTPRYVLDLSVLAKSRGVDPDKYAIGLGQLAMSVAPPGEDIVTMGASAAEKVLRDIDKQQIEMLLFATESGIDQSKAAGLYLHELLGLSARCRTIELKQACYSATAAIQLALPYLRENPNKKVLVVASDIARYGLGTAGESSQGAGAIAMILSAHPRLVALEPDYGVVSENNMDFWRPNYRSEALVDGKYSSKLYLTMLDKSFTQYSDVSKRKLSDHAYFCYHTPVPRLVEKAHQYLTKLHADQVIDENKTKAFIQSALYYAERIGNTYTASLYISLASLLDNIKEDLAGKRIGFYSYGSGCVAEYFSGVIQPGYQKVLLRDYHHALLAERQILNYADYEKFYQFHYIEDGSEQIIPHYQRGCAHLTKIDQHKRIYNQKEIIKEIWAPGKLILSGEHAVVHGAPALAMAINRYTKATITKEILPQIKFDLTDLAHCSDLSFQALKFLKNKIKRKYHRFISGEYSIRDVLQKPFELAQVALGIFAEALNLSLPHGVKIHVQSEIPIGCGMGSSAATILSVMQSISSYMHLPLSEEKLLQLALEAENMQHGHSSGLDLKIALKGGCHYFHGDCFESRPLPTLPMYLINTGTPKTSTGQCVEKVRPLFSSSTLCQEFTEVTNKMDWALQQSAWPVMQESIRDNQRLLTDMGVVPKRVQQFITEIEAMGGAAKISGSGAVEGDCAGAVLVVLEDRKNLAEVCHRYAYEAVPITGALRGVHAA
jgi:hydroxymethylglutaryl-CoA synthase